jgi:hypothetical protein
MLSNQVILIEQAQAISEVSPSGGVLLEQVHGSILPVVSERKWIIAGVWAENYINPTVRIEWIWREGNPLTNVLVTDLYRAELLSDS